MTPHEETMNPIDLPPEKFAEYLKERRENFWKFNPDPKGKNNRSYKGARRYSDFGGTVKRSMQRQRTP